MNQDWGRLVDRRSTYTLTTAAVRRLVCDRAARMRSGQAVPDRAGSTGGERLIVTGAERRGR